MATKKSPGDTGKFNNSRNAKAAGIVKSGAAVKQAIPTGSVRPNKVDRSGKNLGGSNKTKGNTGPTNSPNGTNQLKKK